MIKGFQWNMELDHLDKNRVWIEKVQKKAPPATVEDLVETVPFTMHKLYPKQQAIISDPARFTITEATTKAGKTMSHLEWLIAEACATGYGNFWWVATVYITSMMAYERCKRRLDGFIMYKGKYIRVSDPVPYKAFESKREIKVGGATIVFRSADKSDNLYGEDVLAVVGDEATRWREASWTAIYTTLTATKGKAKLIGNVKGRNNWCYFLARKAEKKEDSELSYHKLTALDAVAGGVIEQDTVDSAKRHMKSEDFLQLYMAEAAEDGGNPFGVQNIENMMIEDASDDRTVCYGVDFGDKVDFTWIIGLDKYGCQTKSIRFNGVGWNAQIPRIQKIIGSKPALVDETGIGEGLLLLLQQKCKKVEGIKFSPGPTGNRHKLLQDLEYAIDDGELAIFDDRLKAELQMTERHYTSTGRVWYGVPDGEHDDGIMSLAMANRKLMTLGMKSSPGGRNFND